MKTIVRSSFELKSGSISRSEARAAAREAKRARDSRRRPETSGQFRADPNSPFWERYLGHFGGSANSSRPSPRKKAAAKKSTARKKSSGRKKTSSGRKKTLSGRKSARI